jgi:hypothetical protein
MFTSKFTLNNLRTLRNYGLYVTGNTLDPIFSKGWIKTKPNILIKNNKCYFDYSHAFNTSDLIYLNQTFSKIGVGATFYMESSSYYDEEKDILKNLGGTFCVTALLNEDRVIVADISSGMCGSSNYDYFEKNNFTSTPQFKFENYASFTGYYLVNSLSQTSPTTFESMGILGEAFGYEEYIDLTAGICENSERIKVLGSTVLKDSQEILYFSSGGTFQDMGNTLCSVNLYIRGDPDLLQSPKNTSVTGIYTVSNDISNAILYCFENQTLNQSILRRASLDTPFTGSFLNCKNCAELIYGLANTMTFDSVGYAFDNLIFLYVINGSSVNASSALTGSFVTNSTGTVRVTSSINKIIKIDISHPTLIDYDLTIYSDANRTTLVAENTFMKYGTLGYNNSFAIIKNYQSNSQLYCTLQGPSTIYFTIQV